MDCQLCQLRLWCEMSVGSAEVTQRSLFYRVKLYLKRHLSPETKRAIKRRIALLRDRTAFRHFTHTGEAPVVHILPGSLDLEAGELVRIRSFDEIAATLDVWGELRGCAFMNEMQQYCGTVQRVLKPVRQFLDERDYHLKKTKGMVLLENVICQGMAAYGPCDRSCFYFWREEWLEQAA